MIKFGLFLVIFAFALTNAKPFDDEQVAEAEIIRIIPKLGKKLIPEEELKNLVDLFKRSGKADEEVNINEQVDQWLVKLNHHIIMSGLDPTPLEDEGFEWEFKWLLITYSAQMTLKNGWLQGLGTLERVKDCTLTSDGEKLTLTLPLTFTDLLFNYEYKAKLMNIGPSGGIDGKIRDSKFTITINVDIITLQAELESYKLNKAGKISLKFTGNVLVDWMVNMFTSVVITFLSPVLKIFVSNWVFELVTAVIASYNEAICSIVGSCF